MIVNVLYKIKIVQLYCIKLYQIKMLGISEGDSYINAPRSFLCETCLAM